MQGDFTLQHLRFKLFCCCQQFFRTGEHRLARRVAAAQTRDLAAARSTVEHAHARECASVFLSLFHAEMRIRHRRELRQVRHTTVRCARGEAPAFVLKPPEATELAAASERLDAVAAAVWQLSRAEAKALVTAGQMFVDGLAAQNADAPLQEGALVSVRGRGRFRYEGPVRQTRSGRLRVRVRIY